MLADNAFGAKRAYRCGFLFFNVHLLSSFKGAGAFCLILIPPMHRSRIAFMPRRASALGLVDNSTL